MEHPGSEGGMKNRRHPVTNVIHVRFPTPEDRRASHLGPELKNFATARRATTDAFWLKENGELLNILECTSTAVPRGLLAVHEETYAGLPEQLAFFPQYYRFLLSIALDLEALGLLGDTAERLCDHVLTRGLVQGETSDIQRLEAERLLQRRGRAAPVDAGVEARARDFASRPDRFALPNKKAAYELTHIVFYLTEYGRKPVDLGDPVRQSLENVGIWAFLDGNSDLLAEIYIAMRFLSYSPVVMWEEWIASEMKAVEISTLPDLPQGDAYHCAFMGAWLAALRGTPAFSGLGLPDMRRGSDTDALVFAPPAGRSAALRELSRHLYTLGPARSGDWARMAPRLQDALSGDARDRLRQAATATDGFARFFESFARAVPA
jgi:hypothetical protein